MSLQKTLLSSLDNIHYDAQLLSMHVTRPTVSNTVRSANVTSCTLKRLHEIQSISICPQTLQPNVRMFVNAEVHVG